jgi:uncharacterized membrane protein
MLRRLHIRLQHRLRFRESWVILFILGIILINFPFLQIFNRADLVFGLPLMFLYLFIGWAISILIVYLFTLANQNTDKKLHETDQP